MGKFKDLAGQVFGRLTALEPVGKNEYRQYLWRCKCACGKECVVASGNLISGNTKSCGCLRGQAHGLSYDAAHVTWKNIKTRCFNPNGKSYKYYGARGITMYEPWIHDFKAFYDYVSKLEHCGEKGYSLDRIENDKNYEPGNLRYATQSEQNRNQHSNIWVEYQGEKMCLKGAAERSGINYDVLLRRYARGDRGERLFRAVSPRKQS